MEVPACKSMLVTKQTPDLDDLEFIPGKHYIPYKTKEEALEIIKQGPNKEIIEAGFNHVMKTCIADVRCKPILEILLNGVI
jgi:hypothetical protein